MRQGGGDGLRPCGRPLPQCCPRRVAAADAKAAIINHAVPLRHLPCRGRPPSRVEAPGLARRLRPHARTGAGTCCCIPLMERAVIVRAPGRTPARGPRGRSDVAAASAACRATQSPGRDDRRASGLAASALAPRSLTAPAASAGAGRLSGAPSRMSGGGLGSEAFVFCEEGEDEQGGRGRAAAQQQLGDGSGDAASRPRPMGREIPAAA